MDLRITATKGHDLIDFEFASNASSVKYHKDHRKILRESKNIGDYIYKQECIGRRKKESVNVRCVQVAAAEGEVVEIVLVDNGLYLQKKIRVSSLASKRRRF
jgi:hypothetical protein